jgi:uncharacterized protein YlxP (DUF503 family)
VLLGRAKALRYHDVSVVSMSVIVGLLSVEMFIPHAQSLKEKRMVLRSVKDRLKKLNVSVAEVEHQNVWQRAGLGIVTIGNGRAHVDEVLAAAVDEIERSHPGLIARTSTELLT